MARRHWPQYLCVEYVKVKNQQKATTPQILKKHIKTDHPTEFDEVFKASPATHIPSATNSGGFQKGNEI